MARTISTSPVNPQDPNSVEDVNGAVVDGLEALRQRVVQRLRFPIRTWSLDTRLGTENLLGHGVTTTLAASILNDAIRDEGGSEVTGITDVVVTLDGDTRVLRYSANVNSIYGSMTISGAVTG